MVNLPRTCKHCDAKLMHYGSCNCVDASLDAIDAQRKQIHERLEALKGIEKALLKQKLIELGAIGG